MSCVNVFGGSVMCECVWMWCQDGVLCDSLHVVSCARMWCVNV